MEESKYRFGQHWRAIFGVIAVIVGIGIFYELRSILLPFLFGLLLAYILLPLISRLEAFFSNRLHRPEFSRVLSILIIYLLMGILILFFFFIIFSTVFNAVSNLIANASNIISSASNTIQTWIGFFVKEIPLVSQEQVNAYLQSSINEIITALKGVIYRGIIFIPSSLSLILSLASLPLFLFYLLSEWDTLRDRFYSLFSPSSAGHIRNILIIVGDAMAQYFRGQFILSIIVGCTDFVGLTLLDIKYAPALGFIGALGEFIPVAGPWINAIIGALVTLSVAPGKLIWVIMLYICVQLVENTYLVPKIQGKIMHIHPAVVLVLLVIGSYLAGLWGTIMAIPVAASGFSIYNYFRHGKVKEDTGELPERK